MTVRIEKSTYTFLRNLAKNNNREWFAAHKEEYHMAHANVQEFVDALIARMNRHDHIETPNGKKALYRIYNDVRFSKNKEPYTSKFSGRLQRLKPMLRGGYYFTLKPGESRVGCGFTYPNSEDLNRIRMDIQYNYKDWNKILKGKKLRSTFGEMLGEQVKTTPKGFSKDDPAIELLRYKQFWFVRYFSDKEVLADNFLNEVDKTYRAIRPFFDYMSEVLGTDLNGEPIIY